jgi:hypothetical protein
MSKSQAAQIKDQLVTLLNKTPPARHIDTLNKAKLFKDVHGRVTKYVKSGKSNLTELQSHLSSLVVFYQ